MRIAALVKPIRDVCAATNGKQASRADLVLDPFSRRAVAQACELAAAIGDGTVTVVTLGPPSAERVAREAMTAAAETDVACDGLVVDDPGPDPMAIGRALADALLAAGGFDLILTGRRGADGDGGHIGPQVAARLGLPFVGPARHLSLQRSTLHVRCELDDGWAQAAVELPAVVSCGARLIEPSTAPSRATDQLVRFAPRSPSRSAAGAVEVRPRAPRERIVLEGPVDQQVTRAVAVLHARGALHDADNTTNVTTRRRANGTVVAVVTEPARRDDAGDLLAAAARVVRSTGGQVVAIGPSDDPALLGPAGADRVVRLEGSDGAEDVAGAVVRWADAARPAALLVTSTDWGREVAARTAVALDGTLLAGATSVVSAAHHLLEVEIPVLGGGFVATRLGDEPPVVVTIRPGSLPRVLRRAPVDLPSSASTVPRCSRVRVKSRTQDADLAALDRAAVVVGVGLGVDPADYARLTPLVERLGAALACTRPVADRHWLSPARQVGLTGRVLTPRLYVAVGVVGAVEHMVGVAGAGTILALHPARDARVFDAADVGIVADWRDVVGRLVAALGS